MNARWNYAKQSHEAIKPLAEAAAKIKRGAIDTKLIDLVNLRASLLNGCALCVDMHVKEMKLHGERELRAHHVAVWEESPLFDDREKAALAWTDAVTRLAPNQPVPDSVYDRVRTHFSEQELSDLTFAIGLINLWNRVGIASRAVPGSLDAAYGLDKAGY